MTLSKMAYPIFFSGCLSYITMLTLAIRSDTNLLGLASLPLNNIRIREALDNYLRGDYNYGPIEHWDTSQVTDMSELFNFDSTDTFNGDISHWDVSNVSNMDGMFTGASSFNGDISKWNVSKVSSMRFMFWSSQSFNGDLSQWDVSTLSNMKGMFYDATSFNGNLSQWDVSNVSIMSLSFAHALSFNGDVSQWNVSNVLSLESMDYMFYSANSFDQELCWDVSSTIVSMFYNSPGRLAKYPMCIPLDNDTIRIAVRDYLSGGSNFGPIAQWNTCRVTDMEELFLNAESFNANLSQWDVSSVSNMNGMFSFAADFNGDVSQWDVSSLSTMNGIFGGTVNFNGDVSQWNVSNVSSMDYVFMNSILFNRNISEWDVSNVSTMEGMFRNAQSFNVNISWWNTSKVLGMRNMFMDAHSFNENLSKWDISNLSTMDYMFSNTVSFNQELCWKEHDTTLGVFHNSHGRFAQYPTCIVFNDTTIRKAVRDYLAGGSIFGSIAQWNTSQVTDMEQLFYMTDTFNGDLSHWDVSKVTNMMGMFSFTTSFNSDVSEWDVSKVSNIQGMFANALFFNGNLSKWDVSNVSNMDYVFANALPFNSDLSQWNVSKVSTMEGMFVHASNFTSNISKWDVSRVSDMHFMFMDSHSFNVNISKWDISNVLHMNNMFYNASSFEQVLCWNTAASTTSMFEGSSGMFSRYKDRITTTTLTPIVNHTVLPTSTPMLNPTNAPYYETSPSGPLRIISGLSSNKQKWCMCPANHSLIAGTKIVISSCKTWNSYKWTIDNEGKIINYKDTSLCIQFSGLRMTIEKCRDGLNNQKWIYSSNGRKILSVKNGLKEVAVASSIAFEMSKVKLKVYLPGVLRYSQSQMWEIEYDSSGPVSVPIHDKFMIISNMSSYRNQWCLYPSNNSLIDGTNIAISKCKAWDTYKWMMDYEGKIVSVKSPRKCIEYSGKNMYISACNNGNIFQRWAYSIIDQKLVTLKSGLKQATVEDGSSVFTNSQVKLLPPEVQDPHYQTWKIKNI